LWCEVDLAVLRERVGFVGRARSFLAAVEAQMVGEIARRTGDATAEEMLRRDQKRSRRGARRAVRTAGQLEWAPVVAEKLAEGAITPAAADLILDAAGDAPVDQRVLLEAAEEEPDDKFRRTLTPPTADTPPTGPVPSGEAAELLARPAPTADTP
jgi:hypothetical protein